MASPSRSSSVARYSSLASFISTRRSLTTCLPRVGQLVRRLETVVDVDRQTLAGQVGDVAHRGAHVERAPEELGDGLRLGWRLDDDEGLGHALYRYGMDGGVVKPRTVSGPDRADSAARRRRRPSMSTLTRSPGARFAAADPGTCTETSTSATSRRTRDDRCCALERAAGDRAGHSGRVADCLTPCPPGERGTARLTDVSRADGGRRDHVAADGHGVGTTHDSGQLVHRPHEPGHERAGRDVGRPASARRVARDWPFDITPTRSLIASASS